MATYNITFVFKPNQRIVTPLGDNGIVTLCTIDESEVINYFVKTSNGSTWWTEAQLIESN